jgi:ATP-binding cassette subfamily F protein 3
LDSVYWLEDFLQRQSIPMVIVSHDREFLDRVCNKIVDVEDGKTVSYQGNYSKFLEQKKNRLEVWRDKYDKQVRYVKEEDKWLKKARNDPNMAQQVKAKEAALEKYKASEDYMEPPPKDKRFRFRFPPAPRCSQSIVEASKLGHGYGEGKYKTLFENVDIAVDRGERIGFVGPNGSGTDRRLQTADCRSGLGCMSTCPPLSCVFLTPLLVCCFPSLASLLRGW